METLAYSKISVSGPLNPAFESVLTPEALAFLEALHARFNHSRLALLEKREVRQTQIDNGVLPDFLWETKQIRNSDWKVAPIKADIQDRRVEITGPVERKMIINALNSGAKVFMADFEDSNAPSWENNLQGQINLSDAINKTISYTNPTNGKAYKLNPETAVLFVRPRGWHLEEKGLLFDGLPASGSLVDFGLYFFRNAHQLIANGSAPYFYLPKIESYLEARLWNQVFVFAQNYLNIPQGTIKATVLIETILASFELEEILYELKEHSAGLNCGRWDYIFSFIKKFRNHPSFLLPDRDQVTMAVPFMSAYSKLVIKTCHKRGAHAMGGMAAFIPIKNNEEANNAAIAKVKADKEREALNGHDGTWVAHPGLVQTALDIFNEVMPTPNQISKQLTDFDATAADLLAIPEGTITEAGLRKNINVAILYIESWLSGNGAAAIYNLMEDAATAEISRTQVWQCIKHKAILQPEGIEVTPELVSKLITDEMLKIQDYVGDQAFENGHFGLAKTLFEQLIDTETFHEFLTLEAYKYL
ncbi:MAG: malate synthase A [Flexibacteraceae bacterium]